MALTLSGRLYDPFGNALENAGVRFRAARTSTQVLANYQAETTTDPSGDYTITVQYATYHIEARQSASDPWYTIARSIPVTTETTSTDINALIVAYVGAGDATPEIVLEIEAITAEASAAAARAEAAAEAVGDPNTLQVDTLTGRQDLSTAISDRSLWLGGYEGAASIDTTSLTNGQYVAVSSTGRRGQFEWMSGDQSSVVAPNVFSSTSVDSGAGSIEVVGHGMKTGDGVFTLSAVNGLTASALYRVIVVDEDNVALANSYINARDGVRVSLSGSSAVTLRRLRDPARGVYATLPGDISGSLGVLRRTSPTLRPEDFGADGDAVTDDFEAVQSWLDYLSRYQVEGVAEAAYRYTRTLLIRENVKFTGHGANFGTRFLPDGCAGYFIDGDEVTGGFVYRVAIRDVSFHGDNAGSGDTFAMVNNSYRVVMDNVWHNNIDGSSFTRAFSVTGACNACKFDSIFASGLGVGSGGGVGLYANIDTGKPTFINPNFENFQTCYEMAGGHVDMYAPYVERFNVGFSITSGIKTLNLFGGIYRLPSASSIGIRPSGDMSGSSINVFSPSFETDDPATKRFGMRGDAITSSGNINVYGADTYWILDPSGYINVVGVEQSNQLVSSGRMLSKSIEDEVSTSVASLSFKGSVLDADGGNVEMAVVSVKALSSKNGIGKGLSHQEFVMAKDSSNNYYITPLQEISSAADGAGNYIVSSLSVSAAASGTSSVIISAAINLSGGLSQGTSADVVFHIEAKSNTRITIVAM